MENSPYTPPDSDVETKDQKLALCFATLNIWRKIYIVLVWVTSFATAGVLLLAAGDAEHPTSIIIIVLAIVVVVIAFWSHWAITKRKVGHITTLAIVYLILGGNLIGCLIMISIRRVTVKEHEKYSLENA